MALQTRSYDDLRESTSALVSRDLNPREAVRIDALYNLAARRLYDATPFWERWLRIGEPRSVTNSLIGQSEDGIHVFGEAKTSGGVAIGGLYTRATADVNSLPAYERVIDGLTYRIAALDPNGDDWEITETASGDVFFQNTPAVPSATVPVDSWTVGADGAEPAPICFTLADIDTLLHVHRREPYLSGSAGEYFFSQSGTYYRISGLASGVTEAYCTYKKKLDVIYGEGSAGTTNAIPDEWFTYMAHYAAYHWERRATSRADATSFTVSLRMLEELMYDALDTVDQQRLSRLGIAKRVHTHLSNDQSLYY